MCDYISTPNVAPGWGCCRCKSYNGLQRPVCRVCHEEAHTYLVPDTVVLCTCGAGFEPEQTPASGRCPNCGAPFPPVPGAGPTYEAAASLDVPTHDPSKSPPPGFLQAGLQHMVGHVYEQLAPAVAPQLSMGGRFVLTLRFEPAPPQA